MRSQQEIAIAIDNARDYLAEHPDETRYQDSPAAAVVEGGLRVLVTGPSGESLVTDMVKGVGGAASAPSPGWMFRAARASCAATLISMRAAEKGIPLSRLEVVVESESDDRGLLGVDDDVPAGPLSTRLVVRIASENASEQELRDIADWGVEHSPVDDAVRRAIPVDVVVETGS